MNIDTKLGPYMKSNDNTNKISNSNSYITISSKKNNELKINLNNINFYKNIYNVKNNNIKQGKKIIDYYYRKLHMILFHNYKNKQQMEKKENIKERKKNT